MEDETLDGNEFAVVDAGSLPNEILTINLDSDLVPATPSRNISFHSDEHGKIGELNWDDGPMIFIGDAEESAKIFFDHIIRMVHTCGCPKCEEEDDS